jgi:alkylated DNA repair dioxygenase AlkB
MEEACNYVEKIVNDEMRKRKRFPLEWGGAGTEGQMWRANVAASNCYNGGKESVGFHSDQLTYLGPYPTIASLSLGECMYTVHAGQINGAFHRDEQSVPTPGGRAC